MTFQELTNPMGHTSQWVHHHDKITLWHHFDMMTLSLFVHWYVFSPMQWQIQMQDIDQLHRNKFFMNILDLIKVFECINLNPNVHKFIQLTVPSTGHVQNKSIQHKYINNHFDKHAWRYSGLQSLTLLTYISSIFKNHKLLSLGKIALRHLHKPLTHWSLHKISAILQLAFSNAFSLMKMYEFQLKFHLSLFLRVQLIIFQHWFR